ncbi:MAG: hypothetical protein KF830_16370 [Planctomycetes bacterium]|nr:hypothetical protein [Planctomycetota bacterium]
MADGADRQHPDDEPWTRQDGWIGALFLFTGFLVTAYACMAMRNGIPAMLWAMGWVVGPLLLLLGGHGVWRALGAGRRDRGA